MDKLYILSGPPGSGKSSWAEEHIGRLPIISRDIIRFYYLNESKSEDYFSQEKTVESEFYGTTADYLNDGEDAVADATHVSTKSIRKTIGRVKEYAKRPFKVTVIRFDTPLGLCLERNAKREGLERVPDKVVNDMAKSFQSMSVDDIFGIPEVEQVITISKRSD